MTEVYNRLVEQQAHNINFSVVIPVYNRSKIIRAALESVRNQSHQKFDCYVVDDGSNDSAELKAAVESLNDARFHYIWQKNGGGGVARNTGITASQGDWIALLDSDDSYSSHKLEAVAQEISRHPEFDIWTHLASMDRGGGISIIRPRRLPDEGESVTDMMFKEREFMQTSTLVVRATLAKDIMFDPTLRKAQDVDFMVRLERAGARLKCIPRVLSVWLDMPEENRVGAPRRPENVSNWYEHQKTFWGRPTRYAFEATYLSYEIAKVSPVRALFFILRAMATRAIGLKIGILSLMRAFIAQPTYRKIVDALLPYFAKNQG